MVVVQRGCVLAFFSFLLCFMGHLFSYDITTQSLVFDRLYPETYVSRVLKTMKQLHISMMSIKNTETRREDCALANIIEIQSLSVLGALQELDRVLEKGIGIAQDHSMLIQKLWNSLQALAKDEQIERYLRGCNAYLTKQCVTT